MCYPTLIYLSQVEDFTIPYKKTGSIGEIYDNYGIEISVESEVIYSYKLDSDGENMTREGSVIFLVL
jgi:hypothetical protein